jgi:hypothetical protein
MKMNELSLQQQAEEETEVSNGSTELAVMNNGPIDEGFSAGAEEAARRTIRGDLLHFDNGRWTVGQDKTPIPDAKTVPRRSDPARLGTMGRREADERHHLADFGRVLSQARGPRSSGPEPMGAGT